MIDLGFSFQDKLLHFLVFGFLALLMARSFKKSKINFINKYYHIWAIALTAIYGIFDEYHQYFVPGRFSTVGDWLADFLTCRCVSVISAVGFVTNVINHVVTTGGVAGYTIRVLMMARHGVSLKDVAAVSIVHFYLTSLDMMIMLPVSLAYLLRNAQVKPGITVSLIVLKIGRASCRERV